MAFSNSCLIVVNNISREYIDDFPKYLSQGFEKLSEILPSIIPTIKNLSNTRWGDQENKIEFNDEETNIGLQILIQPSYKDLRESIKKLIEIDTKEKFIVYVGSHGAGYSSDWLLEDGLFSANSMLTVLSDSSWIENNSLEMLPINILTPSNSAHWNKILSTLKVKETKQDRVRVFSFSPEMPSNAIDEEPINQEIDSFCKVIHEKYQPVLLNDDILKSTQNTGTLQLANKNGSFYIFDEGCGQSNLMALNGFNLLIDAGYKRSPEFWRFLQKLEKIDTHILTSWNETNLFGVQSLLDFKSKNNLNKDDPSNPNLSYCILPIGPNPTNSQKQIDFKSPLEVNIETEAQKIIEQIKVLEIPLLQMCRDSKSITNPHQLYFKLGQGCLDAFPLWPCSTETSGDSKRYVDEWQKDSKSQSIYFDELVKENSCSFLLIWNGSKLTIESPNDDINMTTRILISSSCHESNLLKSLEEFSKINISCNTFSGKVVEKKLTEKKLNSAESGKSKDSKEKSNLTPKSNDHAKTNITKKPTIEKSKEINKGDIKTTEKKILDKPLKAKSADLAKGLLKKDESTATENKSKHSTSDHTNSSKLSAKSAESKDPIKVKDKNEADKKIIKKSGPTDKTSVTDIKKTVTKPLQNEIPTKKPLLSDKNSDAKTKKPSSNDKIPEATEVKKPLKKSLIEGSDSKKTAKPPLSKKPIEDSNVKKEVKKALPSKTSEVVENKKPIHKLANEKPSEASEVKKTTKKAVDNVDVKKPIKKITKEEITDSKKLTKPTTDKSIDKSAPIKKSNTGKSEIESKKASASKPSSQQKPLKSVKGENLISKKDVKNKIADTTINKNDLVSDVEKVDVVCPPSISLNTDDTLNNIDTSELLGKMEEIGPVSHVEDDQLLITGERFDLQSTPLSDLITDSPEHPKTEEDAEALKTDALSIDQDLLITNEEFPEDEKVSLSIHDDYTGKGDEIKNMSNNIENDMDIDVQNAPEENKLIESENLKQYGIYEDGEFDEEHHYVEPVHNERDAEVGFEIKESANYPEEAIQDNEVKLVETEYHEKREFDNEQDINDNETKGNDLDIDSDQVIEETKVKVESEKSENEFDNLEDGLKNEINKHTLDIDSYSEDVILKEDTKLIENENHGLKEFHDNDIERDTEQVIQDDLKTIEVEHEAIELNDGSVFDNKTIDDINEKIQEESEFIESEHHTDKEFHELHDHINKNVENEAIDIDNYPEENECDNSEVVQEKENDFTNEPDHVEEINDDEFEIDKYSGGVILEDKVKIVDNDDNDENDFEVENEHFEEIKESKLEADLHSEIIDDTEENIIDSDHRDKDFEHDNLEVTKESELEADNYSEVIHEDEVKTVDSDDHIERDSEDEQENIEVTKESELEADNSEVIHDDEVKITDSDDHMEKDFEDEHEHLEVTKESELELDNSEVIHDEEVKIEDTDDHKEIDFKDEHDHIEETKSIDSNDNIESNFKNQEDHFEDETKDEELENVNYPEEVIKEIELANHRERKFEDDYDHLEVTKESELEADNYCEVIHEEKVKIEDTDDHIERDFEDELEEHEHLEVTKESELEADNSEVIQDEGKIVDNDDHMERDFEDEHDEHEHLEVTKESELAADIHSEVIHGEEVKIEDKEIDYEDEDAHIEVRNESELETDNHSEVIHDEEKIVDSDDHMERDFEDEHEELEVRKESELEADIHSEVIHDEEVKIEDTDDHKEIDFEDEHEHLEVRKESELETDNAEVIHDDEVKIIDYDDHMERDFEDEHEDLEVTKESELKADNYSEVHEDEVKTVDTGYHMEKDFEELDNLEVTKESELEADNFSELHEEVKTVESDDHQENDFKTEQDELEVDNYPEVIQDDEIELADFEHHQDKDFQIEHEEKTKDNIVQVDHNNEDVIGKEEELIDNDDHDIVEEDDADEIDKDFETEQHHFEVEAPKEVVKESETEFADNDDQGINNYENKQDLFDDDTKTEALYDSYSGEVIKDEVDLADNVDHKEKEFKIQQCNFEDETNDDALGDNYGEVELSDNGDYSRHDFETKQDHVEEKTEHDLFVENYSDDVIQNKEEAVKYDDQKENLFDSEQDCLDEETKNQILEPNDYSKEMIQEKELFVNDDYKENDFVNEEETKDDILEADNDPEEFIQREELIDNCDQKKNDFESDQDDNEIEHQNMNKNGIGKIETDHDEKDIFDRSDLQIENNAENEDQLTKNSYEFEHDFLISRENKKEVETPQDDTGNGLSINEIDLLHKEFDDLQMASNNSENNQDIERYMPDSESNDSDLSVDIVKDHTTLPPVENDQNPGFQPISTLDDIIEDASPSQPESYDRLNEIFSDATLLNNQTDDSFNVNTIDQNDLLHDSEEHSTPDILRGLKHMNLSEPTEISIQQIIEDEEIIDYQTTNINFDQLQSNNSQSTDKHFIEDEASPFESNLHHRESSVESASSDLPQQLTEKPFDENEYNIPCKVDHESTVPYTNGNKDEEHFTESTQAPQWNDPLGLPMPTLITGKPTTKSSPNPKPSEKTASPVASAKLKSSNTPTTKLNGTSNNGHRTTDSPKNTSSPRTSVAPRPSAPKSAPLAKTTTPKATKKPEIIDHSKFPAFYMEIAYIPVDLDGNVNPTRVTEAFFTRVRARQYILPGLEHSSEVLNSLLTAKGKWSEQDKEVEVRLIPIKMTDTLKKWAGKHAQELSKLNIKIGAAVEHCSVSLGDDDSVSCVAHRIDF